ncbi:MAG: hypothetical protein R3Y63_09760 [Eubacteriales bacterium]
MISSIKYSISNFTFLGIAKFLVVLVGIGNMILMPTYSAALLLLENQICGFIMFLFILCGLVSAFGALRTDGEDIKKTIFTILASVASIGMGIYLNIICMNALNTQPSLDINKFPEQFTVVGNAINLSVVVCVAYGIGLLAVIIVQAQTSMKKKKKEAEAT